ncbi:MAG: dihydrodipicolinate reductase C-terminal domain-containing protein [Eisenbergiella sp.]
MVKINMNGCNGHMGQVISELVAADDGAEIVAGIDIADNRENGYPVFTSPEACDVEADVGGFSSYKAVDGIVEYCRRRFPGTVYYRPDAGAAGAGAGSGKEVAILRSANMSLGINLLLKLIQRRRKPWLRQVSDMEIVERHHKLKCDAPSGTAIALGESLNEAMDGRYHFVSTAASAMSRDRRKSASPR